METLSRREEDALMKSTKAKALKECDPLVKRFAECAKGRTLTVTWACKKDFQAIQDCMKSYTNDDRMEELRQEYVRQRESNAAGLSFGAKE